MLLLITKIIFVPLGPLCGDFNAQKILKIIKKKVIFFSVCDLDRSILSTKTYLFIINFKENFLSKL